MQVDQYAVFGNPIQHSRSPQIHAAFARQTGQTIEYTRQLVALDGFKAAADDFFAGGGKGLNITVPFKLDAYEYASSLTRRARQAGAVNTLARQEDGVILGDNTDGAGLVRDLVDNLGWMLEGRRLLLIGAGGAVRGALAPLLELNPASVVIANRTVEKAESLATAFASLGRITACNFAGLDFQCFDIVINGTSGSLEASLPPLPCSLLAEKACCYDMVYGSEPTVFMRWADQQGAAHVADGLGMLIEQAAESFLLWRGVKPDTAGIIADLRARISA
jgi:shikimate dehydrogenase